MLTELLHKHKQVHGIVKLTSPLLLETFSSSTIYKSCFVGYNWSFLACPCPLRIMSACSRNISKLGSAVNVEMEIIIHAFNSSHFDYFKALCTCLNQSTLNCLQTIQIAASRLLTNKRSRIAPVQSSLHWLSIKVCIHFKISVLTLRALCGQTPQYIATELFKCLLSTFRKLSPFGMLSLFYCTL